MFVFVVPCCILLATACSSGYSGTVSSTREPSATAASNLAAPVPLKSSGLLFGNADPHVPAGTPGKVSVVTVGTFPTQSDFTAIPIIVRNATSHTISIAEVDMGAKDSSGKIVASGTSGLGSIFHPDTLKPGEAAIGLVNFNTAVPQDALFDFDIETSPPSTPFLGPWTDFTITQANLIDGHIIGGATNTTTTDSSPLNVDAFCFNTDGMLTDSVISLMHGPDPLPPGQSTTFDVDLHGVKCDSYLVGARGLSKQ